MEANELPTLLVLSSTDLNANPEFTLATRMDWRRVANYLNGEWPIPWPKSHFLGEDARADAWWFRMAQKAKYVVFDVETEQLPDGSFSGKIIQVGMFPVVNLDGKGCSPAIWDRVLYPDFDFVKLFRSFIKLKPMVAHNAPFDVARIYDNFGISVWEYKDLHDTILMHHLLWSEFSHGLEFLASVYSCHPKAKHLGVGNYDYLVGDIVSTAESFEEMSGEFTSDPQTEKLYCQELKPLLPIIIEFMREGVPVNGDFVEQCLGWIPQQLAVAKRIADAYCGFPISLESGPQMRVILDDMEDVFNAAKKLTGVSIKKELTEKGELSLDKDTVGALRSAFLPVDHNEELDAELALQRIQDGAHPLLEAKALWGRVRILMSNYIKPVLIPLEERTEVEERNGVGVTVTRYYYEGNLHVGEGSPQTFFKEKIIEP